MPENGTYTAKTEPSLKANYLMRNIRLALDFLVPLIIFPYVSRILGPAGLGKVEFANSIVSYFLLFTALGIPTYGIREIARVRDNEQECSRTVLELSLILCITAAAGYIVYFAMLDTVPLFRSERILFLIIAPGILLSDFSYEWFYVGIEDQRYITVRYTAVKILQVLLIFSLVRAADDYLLYTGIAVGLNSFATIFNIVRLKKYVKKVDLKTLDIKRHIKPVLLIFAAQVAVSIYTHLDVTMIGLIKNDREVGIYTAANKIVRMIIVFVTSLATVIIPKIENSFKNGNLQAYRSYCETSLRFILLTALPCLTGIELLAEDIILLFAGSQYTGSIFSIRLLSPIILIVGLANFIGLQILYTNRKESIYTAAVSAAAAANFCANIFLIPRFGGNGAITGTVIAETTGLIVMGIAGKHYLREANLRVQPWKYILASGTMGAAIILLRIATADIPAAWRCVLCIIAGIAVYGIVLVALKEKSIASTLRAKRNTDK